MIEYIVNEEKRTVVALIKFGKSQETFRDSDYIFDNLARAFSDLKNNRYYYSKACNNLTEKMFYPEVMTAKAKCAPEDEWDEAYGKELAYERLVAKIRKYRSNSYKIIAELAEKIVDIVN